MLLDTNVVIDVLRERAPARAFVEGLAQRPSISVLTVTEIIAGVRRRAEEEAAADFWKLVNVLRVTHDIAHRAGALVRVSYSIDVADALIAATAEHHGLELATLNVKHFPMFPRLAAPY